jgi:hypothetical protein
MASGSKLFVMKNVGISGVLVFAALIPFVACGGSKGAPLAGAAGQQGTGSAGSRVAGADGTAGGGAGAPGTGGTDVGSAGTSGLAGISGVAGNPGAAGVSGVAGNPGVAGNVAGAGGSVQCDSYCAYIAGVCTGVNAQYADIESCRKICAHLPAGSPNDASGNTVGCRNNAAMTAATEGAIRPSCWAAGPLGAGACGSACENFCPIALSYCSPAEGFAGQPPYASLNECLANCRGWGHQPNPTKPGSYSANYTPGRTPDDINTIDCRAVQLFINGFQGTAAQQSHCPTTANLSAPCTASAPMPDAGADSRPDVTLVSVINSGNWNETTIHPFARRRMLLRDTGSPSLALIDLGKTPALQWKAVTQGPFARAVQLVGNNQILVGTTAGYQVFDYATGAVVKTVTGFGNTQSAYRMANGETMLAQSGTKLTFLGKDDQPTHQISYPGYGFVRLARPTRNGTFLVPSDTRVFEGDDTGKVLWTLASSPGWGHIFEPLLMGDGDVLLSTGFGASCDVIDQTTHLVTKRYGVKEAPDAGTFLPHVFAELEILPNGNIITSNWQGYGAGYGNTGVQVIEFDPAGDVVWYYRQDPAIFSSIEGVMVLDGKDPQYLHVQETSPDSTWQPVIPTP